MKRIYLILLSIQFVYILNSQDRFDQVWLFGHKPNRPIDYFGGSLLNFGSNQPISSYFNINANIIENASICDQYGNLAFYTNGCAIYDSNHMIVPNSDTINPGMFHDSYCPGEHGYYPTKSSEIIIPSFTNDTFSIFHCRINDFGTPNVLYKTTLFYSKIKGIKILDENVKIGAFEMTEGIQAIRHGNGRDWWIILHESSTNRFMKYLLTPSGVIGPFKQEIGNTWTNQYWTAQAAFSSDGNWYAIVSEYNGANLFKFDRCTGQLADYMFLNHPSSDNRYFPRGVCFSPNSKLLYVAADFSLYQYNLSSNDIPNSYELIDTTDSFTLPFTFPSTFYQLMLGPDNKIYGITNSETNVIHVIHNPDKMGKECNLKQHDIFLPSTYFQSISNFPNFRVYDLSGSPCDTLGVHKLPIANFRFNQNTSNFLSFEFIDLSLFNVSVWSWDFGDVSSGDNSSNLQNPIHEFSKAGIYSICLTAKNTHGQDTYCQLLNIVKTTDSKSLIIDIYKEVILAPNPCLDYLVIEVKDYYYEMLNANIYNSIGEVVNTCRLQFGKNAVNISNLSKGLYVVNVFNKNTLIKQDKILKL